MSIRTLLVDDEDLARCGLRARLAETPDVTIVGECSNGAQAIAAIGRLAPDLVFLDVQMPEGSGFEVIEAIGAEAAPYIIFLTAFEQYAVQAFEVRALDYLLKPIDDRRLRAALGQARAALSGTRVFPPGRSVAQAPAELNRVNAGVTSPDRIAVPNGDRVAVVRVSEINWVSAAGNYVSLHSQKKEWLLRETIGELEQRLAPHGFVRIHRSTLVNVDQVWELRALGSGDFIVALRDGTELKMSRNHRTALWNLLGGSRDS